MTLQGVQPGLHPAPDCGLTQVVLSAGLPVVVGLGKLYHLPLELSGEPVPSGALPRQHHLAHSGVGHIVVVGGFTHAVLVVSQALQGVETFATNFTGIFLLAGRHPVPDGSVGNVQSP